MTAHRSTQACNRYRFGAAHGSRSLVWSIVDLLLAWHFHIDLGLTGPETGWVLFALLMLGGAVTFIAGLTLSRLAATGQLVVKVQLPAAIAAATLLPLQFYFHEALTVISAGVAFRIAYAVQDVAQNMLASLLPVNEADARGYARLRVTLSAFARCCVVSGFAIALGTGMTVLLIFSSVVVIISAISLRKLEFPSRASRPQLPGQDYGTIPTRLPRLLISWAIAAAFLPTFNRLFIFSPAVAGAPRSGAWILAGFCFGSVFGPMIPNAISPPILVTMVVSSGSMMLLPMPVAIEGSADMAGAVVHGVALSLIGVRLWAAASGIAMAEAQGGRSRDGIVFGSVILTIHLASAVGMLVLGPLIEGFEAGRVGTTLTALTFTVLGALLLSAITPNGRTAIVAA
ncbi:hypothetical protein [Sphingomonas mollis]|uniref:MFS transporter n=1 Tax=Sphingomonas mollis TaxID=2795726 RepID=A0ABS0XLF6_9SPHN|nr:hypothetical protein [Sphingomonas sp. BT553]MBJ6120876.1 hypothetical protein [Sphingomonas sp. BT553]